MSYKFDFLKDQDVQKLFQIFAGHGQLYVVGGAVRNALMKQPIKDMDFTTDLHPDEVVELCRANRLSVIPTGVQYGTVTVVVNKSVFEVTTMRSDISTDGRHAEVLYTDDIEIDAARRDFTVNALYVNQAGKLFDFYNGIQDVKDRCIRFIDNPLSRIKEDHLRILRFFRFTSNYGIGIDMDALYACRQLIETVQALSVERVLDELLQIMVSKRASEILNLMVEIGFFKTLFSSSQWDHELFDTLIRIEESSQQIDTWRRLYLIVPDAYTVLKFPVPQRNRFKTLSSKKLSGYLLSDLYYFGVDCVLDFELLAQVKAGRINQRRIDLILKTVLPEFPVNGHDLMHKGYVGRQIGKAKRQLEKVWLQSDCQMDRSDLLATLS